MTGTTEARQHWLGLMARAPEGRVAALLSKTGLAPDVSVLRAPEIGTVMVRGRMGATGGAFNLSEMTVTRASVSVGGTVGHGYVAGRSKPGAHAVAVADALLQEDGSGEIARAILVPLEEEENARRAERAGKAAATKVDFFTMVRGESE